MHVHILEVGVDVIRVPIERIALHPEVVAWKVARGVAQVVVLIPQDSLAARWRRNNLGSDWQPDVRDAWSEVA